MVRSDSRAVRRIAAAALGVCLLAGCASTQQKAARLRLNAARILASQNGTRVRAAGSAVAVTGIALVGSGRHLAFVVSVRNPARHPISDLPISVGYHAGRRRPVYLNAGDTLTYFDAHLPAIAAGATLTWVYTAAGHRPPRAARPFALVGAAAAIPGSAAASPPVIRTGVGATSGDGAVTVAVRNLSGVPQYQLPVYAVAERAGRPVAAGVLTLPMLDGNAAQTVHLHLIGHRGQAPIRVQAPPTIFH